MNKFFLILIIVLLLFYLIKIDKYESDVNKYQNYNDIILNKLYILNENISSQARNYVYIGDKVKIVESSCQREFPETIIVDTFWANMLYSAKNCNSYFIEKLISKKI